MRVRLHLVAGNHDPVHPMYRNAQRHFAAYADVFSSIQPYARTKINGTGVILFRFRYAGVADHVEGRQFDQWQLTDNHGRWLLHGHTHATDRRSAKRSICVSLEAWDFKPASSSDIVLAMAGPPDVADHRECASTHSR